jgi:predicted nuclease of restriction endonuclease-like RecB superfamily
MLTSDLVRPRLHHRGGELRVSLLDATNRHWQCTAAELIALLRQQVGQPLEAWEEALTRYEGDRIDYVVVRGLAKVLTDAATFVACETPVTPAQVRAALFARGPAFAVSDLLYPRTRDEVLAEVANELGLPLEQIETLLYADRPCTYLLTDAGPTWSADDLIARYNLELSRAALYWSDGLQVTIHDTYKDFWRYLKLFKLMFWASPRAIGYHIEIDGPLSPFVKSTTRYGRHFFRPSCWSTVGRWKRQYSHLRWSSG